MSAKLTLVENETGVIDRALEIARRRRNTLVSLKNAIRAKQFEEADQLITELIPDEASNRTDKGLDRVASR